MTNFCSSRTSFKKIRQATGWEITFANYIFGKELEFRTYKNF